MGTAKARKFALCVMKRCHLIDLFDARVLVLGERKRDGMDRSTPSLTFLPYCVHGRGPTGCYSEGNAEPQNRNSNPHRLSRNKQEPKPPPPFRPRPQHEPNRPSPFHPHHHDYYYHGDDGYYINNDRRIVCTESSRLLRLVFEHHL